MARKQIRVREDHNLICAYCNLSIAIVRGVIKGEPAQFSKSFVCECIDGRYLKGSPLEGRTVVVTEEHLGDVPDEPLEHENEEDDSDIPGL